MSPPLSDFRQFGALSSPGSKAQIYDAIVIGAGTAGMMLGIAAVQSGHGARVLILEASNVFGGTLPWSGGEIAAAGTSFQRALGIKDTPDIHYADNLQISHGKAHPKLTRLWVDNAAEMTDWLAARGYVLRPGNPRAQTGHHPFSVRRYHGSEGSGRGIFKVIAPIFGAMVASGELALALNTRAVELIQKAGQVRGVVVKDAAGDHHSLQAEQVIIASGGCAANSRMFADLNGVPLYSDAGYPYCRGEGIQLGLAAGGHIWGQGDYIPSYGAVMASDAIPSKVLVGLANDPGVRPPWEIHVNSDGERFVMEDELNNGLREEALRLQKGHRYWVVFDQNAADQAPPLVPAWSREEVARQFNVHPGFTKGQTITELGVLTGINPECLNRTVRDYNQALLVGDRDPWGRRSRPAPIRTPPFYAIRMQGTSPVSTAGLAVDEALRVIRADGSPVEGLYAVGEVLGNTAMAGDSFVGGSMLTPALTFGRWLGARLKPA